MHATTMVFLVVMPLGAAFSNYFLPLQLGARDVAFPRMNALSYWIFLFGGLFLTISFFVGGGPDGGWFGYAPLSTQVSEVVRMDYWALGLIILGVASIASSVNFITTVLTMRAPGMTLMRMPVFSWMTFIISFLLLFSLPMVPSACSRCTSTATWARCSSMPPTGGPGPVAAPVLAVRPPRGLRADPARDGHRLRGAADLRPQAAVRPHLRHLLRHGHRLHGLRGLGPPHVHHRVWVRWPKPPSP